MDLDREIPERGAPRPRGSFADLPFRGAPRRDRSASARPRERRPGEPAPVLRTDTLEATADALDAYLGSIAEIPVLTREETYTLSEAMEGHEATFRRALFEIPGTATLLVERWSERSRAGLTTAVLAEDCRDGSGRDWSRHVDRHMRRVERLQGERAHLGTLRSARSKRELEATAKRIAETLERTGIALEILFEIHRRYRTLFASMRSRPSLAERRRLGLTVPASRQAMKRVEEALAAYDGVKQTFVRHNLRLVVKCARRYRNMGVPLGDLIQEGNLGLVRAVEKFDRRRGFKFSTYAVWWIQQALIRAIQNQSRTVRVPSHIYELEIRAGHVREELRHLLGREPNQRELAAELGVTAEAAEHVVRSMAPIESTDELLPGTDSRRREDVLSDDSARDPVEDIDRDQMKREVERLLDVLSPRERDILEWRYGLGGRAPVTLQEIGDRIGLSRERVRQLEARALRRLREEEGAEALLPSIDAA